jgi:hypothetical protein
VDERQAVALELLQDEALAAEQPGADLLLQGDADLDAAGRAQKRVLLAQSTPPRLARSIATILPGYGAAKATLRRAAARFS